MNYAHQTIHFLVGEGDEKEASFGEKIKPVEVIDVEVGTFKAMLAFIYVDDLSGLNGDNAISVLYAADKYNLPKLVKACLNFPIPELRNVFFAFDQARFLGKEEADEFNAIVWREHFLDELKAKNGLTVESPDGDAEKCPCLLGGTPISGYCCRDI
uniref:BTB domain-containing protein n=1 Tax=Globodera pallida TaxID=36090 RepID=A0A183BTY7_GLOPA